MRKKEEDGRRRKEEGRRKEGRMEEILLPSVLFLLSP